MSSTSFCREPPPLQGPTGLLRHPVRNDNGAQALSVYKAGHCYPGENSLHPHLTPEGSGLAGSPFYRVKKRSRESSVTCPKLGRGVRINSPGQRAQQPTSAPPVLARAGPARAFAKGKAFIHSYSLIHSEGEAMRSEAQLPSPWLPLALHPASLPALLGCLGLLPEEERRGKQPGQLPFQLATALPPTLPPHKLGKTRRKIIFFMLEREKKKTCIQHPVQSA